MSRKPPSNSCVVDLTQAREARSSVLLLEQVEGELAGVHRRLTLLCTGGTLFGTAGGREGRRLLVAQECLLEARRHLLELTGLGALPAPTLPETRNHLLARARERLESARRRLQVGKTAAPALGQ